MANQTKAASKAGSRAKTSKMAGKARPAKRAAGTKRPAGAPRAKTPRPVTTGRGPSAAETGNRLVQLFNSGTPEAKIWDELFHDDFESVEGHGVNLCFRGRGAVEAKAREFYERNLVHSASAEGPYVGSTGFAVKFRVEMEEKSTGKRQTMEEVAVYTVRNGKVVREEFMYSL